MQNKQDLQREITSRLKAIKDDIDSKVKQFLNAAIQQSMAFKQITPSGRAELVRSLGGNKVSNLEEIIYVHLIRIRRSVIQATPGLDEDNPRFLGQLLTLTLFSYEDRILQQWGVLQDITRRLNEQIQAYFMEQKEQLREIKTFESLLLNTMNTNVSKTITLPIIKKSLCICQNNLKTDRIVECLMCEGQFHGKCLMLQDQVQSFICPFCTIHHLDLLLPVSETLIKPQWIQLKGEKSFSFSAKEGQDNIYVRCLRIDNNGGLDDCTWPDLGQLDLNNNKIEEFEPLPVNYSLKKRRDAPLQLPRELIKSNNTLTLSELKYTPEMLRLSRIRPNAIYLIAIYIIKPITPTELIQQTIIKDLTVTADCYNEKVSILCPITLEPMTTPARGLFCPHAQCFDLNNYITMLSKQEQRKWRCIICKRKTFKFMIDKKQLNELQTIKHKQPDCTELRFDKNETLIDTPMSRLLQNQSI